MHLGLVVGLLQLCFASPGIASGKASDFYVSSLPGLAEDAWMPEMHAGLIEAGSKVGLAPSSLFFWHVRSFQDTQTTVIWLNGGPGCSSMDGNLLELGPFRVRAGKNGEAELYNAKDSWAEVANLLFIDQPFGTGYSDPDERHYVTSLEQAAEIVAWFLLEYAQIFPEIRQTNVVLAGESFAGYYVPHIWHALQENKAAWDALGGVQYVLLDNPWLDPGSQYSSFLDFVREHDLLDAPALDKLEAQFEVCIADLQIASDNQDALHSPFSISSCESMITYVTQAAIKDDSRCLNVYDFSLESPSPSCGMEWPLELPLVEAWLSREDVRQAVHAPESRGESWHECNLQVGRYIKSAGAAKQFLPDMLSKAPLLLLVGDNDIMCNGLGQDRIVKNLHWNGNTGMQGELTETPYGTWQSERNLTVAHVRDASHMVPYDKLATSKDILTNFVGMKTIFGDIKPLPSDTPSDTPSGKPSDTPGTPDKSDTPDDEEINRAMYRAYAQAGMVALVVVIAVIFVLGVVWWRNGQGISCMAFVHALLQSGMRFKPRSKRRDYVPLRSMRRPEIIIEEDESDVV